jgi:hypothetical protein
MHKNNDALFESLQSSIDQLRFHIRITAVWIAALIITITILTVVAVLPGIMDAHKRSHAATIDDLNLVAR